MISTDARISPDYFLSQELLDRINVEYAVISNTENLNQLGGASGLCSKLGVNPKFGLDDAHVRQMEAYYGNNAMPVAQMKSIFQIFVSTFSDNAIIVLVTAAIVSIIVEELHDPTEGWIQGTAILVAVIIVAVVTTINEYAKERQFRALEISAQREERASVWRNGCINRINPDGIVVGDILVLQPGDIIPADCVMLPPKTVHHHPSHRHHHRHHHHHKRHSRDVRQNDPEDSRGRAKMSSVICDESSLTGESQEIEKSHDGDCFLLSSCLIESGDQQYAVVISTGINSQWGRIKSNLSMAAEPTPLQIRLERLTTSVGTVGVGVAMATFAILVVYASLEKNRSNEEMMGAYVNAFIMAVVIVVIAVPEGLPLAVTISLAYSASKMYGDECLIRILAACEIMGNVTNICSDKTGTLTESKMKVVEGWIGDVCYCERDLESACCEPIPTASPIYAANANVNARSSQVREKRGDNLAPLKAPCNVIKRIIGENICVNRTAYVVGEHKVEETVVQESVDLITGIELILPGGKSDFKKRVKHTKTAFETVVGNRTEASLLWFANRLGFSVDEVKDVVLDHSKGDKLYEFNSFRKRSSALVHRDDDSVRLYTKGASEWVLANCTMFLRSDGAVQMMNEAKRAEIQAYVKSASACGLRTICLAHKDFTTRESLPRNWFHDAPDNSNLCCDAIVGISDPLRPDAHDVVLQAQRAGITVRMITGDNLNAACAIARQAGILKPGGIAIEGHVFRELSPAEVDDILPRLQVMARSTPTDKLMLVMRLNGHGIPENEEDWVDLQRTLRTKNDRANKKDPSKSSTNSGKSDSDVVTIRMPASMKKPVAIPVEPSEYALKKISSSMSDRMYQYLSFSGHKHPGSATNSPAKLEKLESDKGKWVAPMLNINAIDSAVTGAVVMAAPTVSNRIFNRKKGGAVGYQWKQDRDLLLPGYKAEWRASRPDGGEVVAVTGDGTNDAPALKAADVGLAMGITGTKVALAASDIVILDDKFSSIVNALMWGRTIHDNIKKFVQFQLTVNIVALMLVFVAAVANYPLPLNAVQMLWVNLIMDSLGALALAIEVPNKSQLDSKPYPRSANLICRPMWRNILVQASFQLMVLLLLLFLGASFFNIEEAFWCRDYEVVNGEASLANVLTETGGVLSTDSLAEYGDVWVWNMSTVTSASADSEHRRESARVKVDAYTLYNYLNESYHDSGTSLESEDTERAVVYYDSVSHNMLFTCNSFYHHCPAFSAALSTRQKGGNGDCFDAQHPISFVQDNQLRNSSFSFSEFDRYEETCLRCNELDNALITVIFNTFVFLQIFNMYTSRSIYYEVILLQGLLENPMFIGVSIFTALCQVLLVNYGGSFLNTTPLTLHEWISTVVLAFLGIPVGVLMRCIPVKNVHEVAEAQARAAEGEDTESGNAAGDADLGEDDEDVDIMDLIRNKYNSKNSKTAVLGPHDQNSELLKDSRRLDTCNEENAPKSFHVEGSSHYIPEEAH